MTETLLAFFKAMADESRLKIVGLLAQGERSVQDLAQTLGLKEPTVSHHLKVLAEVGLITGEKRGRWVWYSIVAGRLDELRTALG